MPTVLFPYTKKGEEDARKAAKMHDGKYVSDKKPKGAGKKGHKGIGVMIAVGPVSKAKKLPVRRTSKKA